MTTTSQSARPTMNSSSAFTEGGSDSFVRRAGRSFIISLYGALRAIKLYPVENAAVQKALEETAAHAREFVLRLPQLPEWK